GRRPGLRRRSGRGLHRPAAARVLPGVVHPRHRRHVPPAGRPLRGADRRDPGDRGAGRPLRCPARDGPHRRPAAVVRGPRRRRGNVRPGPSPGARSLRPGADLPARPSHLGRVGRDERGRLQERRLRPQRGLRRGGRGRVHVQQPRGRPPGVRVHPLLGPPGRRRGGRHALVVGCRRRGGGDGPSASPGPEPADRRDRLDGPHHRCPADRAHDLHARRPRRPGTARARPRRARGPGADQPSCRRPRPRAVVRLGSRRRGDVGWPGRPL
ncbi:MAG: hypothetical protein AVDCRST_MAG50-1934, partial [uncultured Acidimicrobiales bacterium]